MLVEARVLKAYCVKSVLELAEEKSDSEALCLKKNEERFKAC